MLRRCRAAWQLRRKRRGRAGEGVEDEEGEDRRQVQRSPERRDDAPEDVQVRVTYRAALHCHRYTEYNTVCRGSSSFDFVTFRRLFFIRGRKTIQEHFF
jgi:hypothetical protein